jgi:hypothetical protein
MDCIRTGLVAVYRVESVSEIGILGPDGRFLNCDKDVAFRRFFGLKPEENLTSSGKNAGPKFRNISAAPSLQNI